MSFLRGLTADGRLANKHDRMIREGRRPPTLVESYFSQRHVEREAEKLATIGYRLQMSYRDNRGFYQAVFQYLGEPSNS